MIIDKIGLNSFGKFKNKEIYFDTGLNILYGENEAGKTTLNTAIKSMLYPLTGSSKENKEKTSYIPGNEKKAESSMTFTLDDGREFETFFTMGKTKRGCQQKIVDKRIGTEFRLDRESVGETFFQVSEDLFDNIAYIKDKTITEMKNTALINQQLALLNQEQGEAEEEIDSVKKLNGAITMIERKNNRLDKLENNRFELLEKRRALKVKEEEYTQLKVRLTKADETREKTKRKLSELTILIDQVSAYHDYDKLEKAEQLLDKIKQDESVLIDLKQQREQVSFLNELSIEQISHCEVMERDIAGFLKEQSEERVEDEKILLSKAGMYFRLMIFQAVLSVVFAGFVFINFIAFSIAAVLSLIVCGFFYNKYRQYKRLGAFLKEVHEQEHEMLQKQKRLKQEYESLLSTFQCGSAKELNDKYIYFQDLKQQIYLSELSTQSNKKLLESTINMEQLQVLRNRFLSGKPESRKENLSELKALKSQLESELNRLNVECAGLDGKALNYKGDMELRIRTEEELSATEDEIRLLHHRLVILKKTRDYMQQAKEHLKTGYLPSLNNEVKDILQQMGLSKYEQIYVDDSLDVTVKEEEQNFIKDGSQLSLGTKDQIYFALRLAIYRLAYQGGEKIPLFLDDPFIRLDDKRFYDMMEFLNTQQGIQIIYYTCHKRALNTALDAKITKL